jgi:hypothetical protein
VHPVRSVSFWFTRRADSFLGFCWKPVEIQTWVSPRRSKREKTTNGFVAGWNCTGLSGRDPWKKHMEDESIEGNVQAMESNEGGD